jgi:lysophospholipase L1-like esterase
VVVLVVAPVLGALALVGRAALVWLRVKPTARYWNRRADVAGELLYVAMGDSTAQGVGASRPERGYVGLLADDLAQRTGRSVRVVNLSVSGARVDGVLHDQLPALRRLVRDEPAELVTISIGSNDAGRTSPEAFRASLRRVLADLPRGARVADVPYFQGGPRLAAAAALSRVVREEVARRPDLVAVDLYDATREMTWRDYAGDYFHPGDRGYQRYRRAFRGPDVSGQPVDR